MIPTIGKKNIGISLKFAVKDSKGAPVDLSNSTVTITISPNTMQTSARRCNLPCNIDDPLGGAVSYMTTVDDFTLGGVMYSLQLTMTQLNGNSYTSSITKIACLDTL